MNAHVVAFSASADNKDLNLSHEIIILAGAKGLQAYAECEFSNKEAFAFTSLRIDKLSVGDIWPGSEIEMVKAFVKSEWTCNWR